MGELNYITSSPLKNVISNIECQHNNGAFQIIRLQIYFGSAKRVSLKLPLGSSYADFFTIHNTERDKCLRIFYLFFPNTRGKLNDGIIIYFHFKVQSQWTHAGFPSVKTGTPWRRNPGQWQKCTSDPLTLWICFSTNVIKHSGEKLGKKIKWKHQKTDVCNGTFPRFTEFLIVSWETGKTWQKKSNVNHTMRLQVTDRHVKFFLFPELQMIPLHQSYC